LSIVDAKAIAADSAIITEEDSCIVALIKTLMRGCILVLIMKISRPACLGVDAVESGSVEALV